MSARSRRRKCRHCQQLFLPDPYNRYHQRFCSAADCQCASKAQSQQLWLAKLENQDYWRGPQHTEGVRRWRFVDMREHVAREEWRKTLQELGLDHERD